MVQGLPISRLVRATVNISPIAAARRGFGVLLLAGDSDVINGTERIREYNTLDSVATDFGTTAPEYLAATLYFGQSPRPQTLMIGRWIRTATAGELTGGILTATEQTLSNWTAITAGSFAISIDGAAYVDVTGLDFSLATNLNGVAATITAALTGATCTWDGSRFTFASATTGTASSVNYLTAAATGTDISALLKGTAATALAPVPGFAAETPLQAVTALANVSGVWYGLAFAASVMPTDDQSVDVSAFIQAASPARICGWTITDTRVLDATFTTDLATRCKDLSYTRTVCQYSSNKYAVTSIFGRAFSVNFEANRSTITLMYKQEPGVVPAVLTETQATALKAKRCNVFVEYQNDTAILQYGVMAGPAYFDEIHGLDWFQDAIQNAVYNVLYTSKTKIPQTDAGQNVLVNTCASVCDEAINNGLAAPGTWNADGFGQLQRGDYLTEGYYIYSEPMALQDQATREQRIAPPIQVALKLAGAIHEVDIIVDVNR